MLNSMKITGYFLGATAMLVGAGGLIYGAIHYHSLAQNSRRMFTEFLDLLDKLKIPYKHEFRLYTSWMYTGDKYISIVPYTDIAESYHFPADSIAKIHAIPNLHEYGLPSADDCMHLRDNAKHYQSYMYVCIAFAVIFALLSMVCAVVCYLNCDSKKVPDNKYPGNRISCCGVIPCCEPLR